MESTTCAISGAGPAGLMLGLLLASSGVPTVVLEKHGDFLRDFRGDTIHASTLKLMDELGLTEEFRTLNHQRIERLQVITDDGTYTLADFTRLPGPYKYITFVPQWDFLDFLVSQAEKFPTFQLRRYSEVTEAVLEDDRVVGLRYTDSDGEHELRADLVVAADGRHSPLRATPGIDPVALGSGMDILWFELSKRPDDPGGMVGRLSKGQLFVRIERHTHWQAAYGIRKGGYEKLRAQGIEAFRQALIDLLPFLADRVHELRTWDDLKMLDIHIDRLTRWWRPGLLCIGDAAHTMSPIAGVGINFALQDAVATANLLTRPLLDGTLTDADLAAVQKRRERATAVTQRFQRFLQERFLEPWFSGQGKADTPWPLRVLARVPKLQGLPARVMAIGPRPEHNTGPTIPERAAALS